MDTCYNTCEPGKGWFSSDEKKWINRMRKLKEKFPDLIEILHEPETNDGCIVCTIPSDWMKISAPKSLTMSEEHKQKLADNLRRIRNAQ